MGEMSFEGATEALLLGKKVTRTTWNDKRTYFILQDHLLQIHKAGEAKDLIRPVILTEEDLLADDWLVL